MVSIVNLSKLLKNDVNNQSDKNEYLEEQSKAKDDNDVKGDVKNFDFDALNDADGVIVPFEPRVLESDIDNVVIPRGLDYGNQEIQRKGVKNTYYCEVCHVPLSSLETMKSHTSGAKHQKKMLALEKERETNIRLGLVDESDRLPGVIQVPNPESAKVKIPIRLHERIRETREPVIGLQYVKEYLAASDPEMEPYYSCELCGSKGTSNSMFSHIMGFKHRQTFVYMSYGKESGAGKSWSQKDLMSYARNNAENGGKLDILIETTKSDNEYPAWPAGKAPWALEKGGSGVPPQAVRSRMELKPTVEHGFGRSMGRDEETTKLMPLNGYKPETKEEAKKMMAVGKDLVNMAMNSPHLSVSESDKRVLLDTLYSILG